MIGATLAALDPDRYGDDLAAFQRSKYVSLTEEQRAAIAAFVRDDRPRRDRRRRGRMGAG